MIGTHSLRNLRVAIQGSPGSYHETAAQNYFGKATELFYCASFRESCALLAGNKVDYTVMAIENTIAGSIAPNYGLLEEHGLHILGENLLPIRLNLLTLPGIALQEIEWGHSHPMALRQCTRFLAGLPNLLVKEGADTAACARHIAERNLLNAAAIGGKAAAAQYGLVVLEAGIEDHPHNYTRFWVLAKGFLPCADADKVTIGFSLKHAEGTLARVLTAAAGCGVNLTRIQSLPVAGYPDGYRFYADMEWETPPAFARVYAQLQRHTSGLHLLGQYKKATTQHQLHHENELHDSTA